MSAYRLPSGSLVVPEVGRECSQCFIFKRWERFIKRTKGHLGHRSYCKACKADRNTAYRKANPEKVRAQDAAWYAANRGKLGHRPGWYPGATNATSLARSQEWALDACFLYVIQMWDTDGTRFYKVGIGPQKRINDHLARHSDNRVMVQIASHRAACYTVEQLLLDRLSTYKYEPVTKFGGRTECLTAAAPVGWLLAEVAHILLDPTDDDASEVAIQRTLDASADEHKKLMTHDIAEM